MTRVALRDYRPDMWPRTGWESRRIHWLAAEVREKADAAWINEQPRIVHYAIDELGETGKPRVQPGDEIGSDKLIVREGDWLISRLNPRKGHVFQVGYHDGVVVASGEFAVARPIPTRCDSRYLGYLLKSEPVRQHFDSHVRSATKSHGRVEFEFIWNLEVDCPLLTHQRQLSRLLDVEMRRINTLIGKNREVARLLIERLEAETTCHYTELTDEGGSLPLRYVARIAVSGVDKHTRNSDVEVKLCNYVDVYRHRRITRELNFMKSTASSSEIRDVGLQTGDVVFTKDSETADDIAIPAYVDDVPADLVLGYHNALARPDPNRMDGEFLFWILRARPLRDYFAQRASGVTRVGLRLEDIGMAPVPVPELEKQKSVAANLEVATLRIESLLAALEHEIKSLEEHRRALITAAVTGQLDLDEYGGVA